MDSATAEQKKSLLWHFSQLIYFSVAEAVIFIFYDFFGAENCCMRHDTAVNYLE